METKWIVLEYMWLEFIGMRFAMAQMKLGIAVILRNLDISLHQKTQVPLEEDPTATFLSKPIGGFWLKLAKRK